MGPKAIDKMLAAEPPREPLDNLQAVWEDFRWRRLKRGHRDPCIRYTAEAKSMHEAIRRACDSRGADGKLFFHQGRVWQVNRDAFAKMLLRETTYRHVKRAPNFHVLWMQIDFVAQKTHGIGKITGYDVTARLAAYRGLVADRIYCHGGVLDGLRSVGIDPRGREWIERDELPEPICYVKNLDWVEDFLCGYRVLIERVLNGE